MERTEAHELARSELSEIASAGYGAASEHVDTTTLKNTETPAGNSCEVELSYHWKDPERDSILVICRITSKNWFTQEHYEQSITLRSDQE